LARTAKKTQLFAITTVNWLTLFRKIIAVYSKNDMKNVNKNADLLIVKAGGAYNYQQASKRKCK
jgi:predicted alternative tryptophan synthase beta-subunit